MTAPAPPPQAARSGPSRKAIIGWTVGMFLFLALAWLAGAVVWPTLDTHCVLENVGGCERIIERLGGRERAARRIVWYLRWRKKLDYSERNTVTCVLGSCHGGPARRVLVKALADSHELVRGCAAWGLPGFVPAEMDTTGLAPYLHRALGAPEAEVRLKAAKWLWRGAGDAGRAVAALLDIMSGEKTVHTAGEAAKELTEMGPRAVPALVEALRSEDGPTRAYAAVTLGEVGPAAKAAVPALLELLAEPARTVKVHPISIAEGRLAFRGFGPGMLEDGKAPLPALAAWALGRIGDARVIGALEARLKGGNETVREAVVEALGQLGAEAGVEQDEGE